VSDHTPLPWHYSRKFRYVSDINHRVIAEIAPLRGFAANASFIVQAVNSYDELVSALEDARSFMVEMRARHGDSGVGILIKAADKALAVANSSGVRTLKGEP
jgi:hypothetical protein